MKNGKYNNGRLHVEVKFLLSLRVLCTSLLCRLHINTHLSTHADISSYIAFIFTYISFEIMFCYTRIVGFVLRAQRHILFMWHPGNYAHIQQVDLLTQNEHTYSAHTYISALARSTVHGKGLWGIADLAAR